MAVIAPTPTGERNKLSMSRIMILAGGWPGHNPEEMGDFLETLMHSGNEVSRASDLNVLRPEVLSKVDILVLVLDLWRDYRRTNPGLDTGRTGRYGVDGLAWFHKRLSGESPL